MPDDDFLPDRKPAYSALKRAFDLAASLIGLAILSPLLAIIAVAIKLDSDGPVFFRQSRAGLHGRPFDILKFRTMRTGEASKTAALVTVSGDKRITRVGHFLRRSKLDELPQLINVALGQMSIVGPRPEVPRYVERYPDPVRDIVLSVRPGITDPASIAFRNESDTLAGSDDPERFYVEQIMPRKLEYYVDYVLNRSPLLDLKLIVATIVVVISPKRD